MQTFFDKILAVIVRSAIKALSEPGVLAGLVDVWIGVIQEQQVKPAKENDEDKKFVDSAHTDGWVK
jgi:hypothetical protein